MLLNIEHYQFVMFRINFSFSGFLSLTFFSLHFIIYIYV